MKNQYIITSVCFKLTKKNHKVSTTYGAIETELQHQNIQNPTLKDVSNAVIAIRQSKLPDPKTIGNAGSFFKNPVITKDQFDLLVSKFPEVVNFPVANNYIKIAAGWLIEQCGFKGMVVGQTGTWKNQALVLVNHGKASGQEVYNFSEHIIETVRAKFEITLEREVNIL